MQDDADPAEAEEIIGRLLDLFRRMQANFEETTAALGLSAAEGQALHHLDVPAPMRAMADSLCCDASYITVLADRLESRGLVNRSPDPDDRRVKRLVLTSEGRELRGELLDAIHATTPALAGLDARQRRALLDLLRALAAAPEPDGSDDHHFAGRSDREITSGPAEARTHRQTGSVEPVGRHRRVDTESAADRGE